TSRIRACYQRLRITEGNARQDGAAAGRVAPAQLSGSAASRARRRADGGVARQAVRLARCRAGDTGRHAIARRDGLRGRDRRLAVLRRRARAQHLRRRRGRACAARDRQELAEAWLRCELDASLSTAGRRGRDIEAAEALEHVAGYTVGNDVSARDWQLKKPGAQWLLGKSFDTFLPLGPWIVTPDEFGDPASRRVRCTVNGEQLQEDAL